MKAVHQGLAIAVEAAERQRDALRQDLARLQHTLASAKGQLEQLTQYAEASDARWAQQAQRCALPELMHHHHQFMARLHHAIGLQSEAVAQQQARVEAARVELLAAELRAESLRKLVARRAGEQAQRRARAEQKDTDEMASRRFTAAARAAQQET